MERVSLNERDLPSRDGSTYSFSVANAQTQWSKFDGPPLPEREQILEAHTGVEILSEYWADFERVKGQRLGIFNYVKAISGGKKIQYKTYDWETFIPGKYGSNSYSVAFPKNLTLQETELIIRFYIDQRFLRGWQQDSANNPSLKSLYFENNVSPYAAIRLAGIEVSGNECKIIIADEREVTNKNAKSFPAVLFPLIIYSNFKEAGNMYVRAKTARARYVTMNADGTILPIKSGEVVKRVDPAPFLPILNHFFNNPRGRVYHNYWSYVDGPRTAPA